MTPTNQAPLYVNRDFAADPLAGLTNSGARRRRSLNPTNPPAECRCSTSSRMTSWATRATRRASIPAALASSTTRARTQLIPNMWTEEIISNFEVGVRSDLANGRAAAQRHAVRHGVGQRDSGLGIAILRRGWLSNCQDTRAVTNQNVGTAHATGLELEMIIAPTERLTVQRQPRLPRHGVRRDHGADRTGGGVRRGRDRVRPSAARKRINLGVQYDCESEEWRLAHHAVRLLVRQPVLAGSRPDAACGLVRRQWPRYTGGL